MGTKLLICTQAVDRNDPVLGFFHRWLEEFATHCEQVTVICLRTGDYELPPHVTVLPLGPGRIRRALAVIRYAYSYRNQYDSVFVHMNPEYILAAGWLWRLMGKRIALWYMHKSVPWRLRAAMPFVHGVCTGSQESFRLATPKLHVLGHGMDIARALPERTQSGGTVRLYSSGRVSRVKGLEVLIDAYLALKKQMQASFVYYGASITEADKAYELELRQRLSESGEDASLILPGSVPHSKLPLKRAEADYFVHASETGSLDKSVLDAILSGLIPVSSSDAHADLSGEFEALLTYPRGDSEALAARIQALEALPESEREHIRSTLKERVVKNHSLAALIPRILQILHG